ncbi:hypothetical protein [Amycolatopsis circi]|uniref:hypothetical protein n=1 Tax=Amycolatopsis circi TaxID=871959 RepID=UPI001ABF98ED|nr:hypothetical protein [Amycolatopsis circi]
MLTTTRVSIARTCFGGVHFDLRQPVLLQDFFLHSELQCVLYDSALAVDGLRCGCCPVHLQRELVQSRDTLSVFDASQASAGSTSGGLTVSRRLVLKAQPVIALRSTSSAGFPRRPSAKPTLLSPARLRSQRAISRQHGAVSSPRLRCVSEFEREGVVCLVVAFT